MNPEFSRLNRRFVNNRLVVRLQERGLLLDEAVCAVWAGGPEAVEPALEFAQVAIEECGCQRKLLSLLSRHFEYDRFELEERLWANGVNADRDWDDTFFMNVMLTTMVVLNAMQRVQSGEVSPYVPLVVLNIPKFT